MSGLIDKVRRDVLSKASPGKPIDSDNVNHLYEHLKLMYKKSFKPVEEHYRFADFFSPTLSDNDIEAKPFVLLLGQYSVGKTTFINNLLGRTDGKGYPGANVGPEPTTDRFVAIMEGQQDRVLPGNAVAASLEKPFKGLQAFGNAFLQRFECSETQADILQHMTFIDTPGVLSGEKQRIGRNYDMSEVCRWFADRSDLILVLFDAHKLDISDELKEVLENLRGNSDKIRIVLNKSDQVTPKQLMRIYGALMWSLGKVLKTPEVTRVYISTFSGEDYHPNGGTTGRELFDSERNDLMKDLQDIPRNAAIRRVNELVKRARQAKTHALCCACMKKMMPTLFGKEKKQREIVQNLDIVFQAVAQEYGLSQGDFPDVETHRKKLEKYLAAGASFASMPKLEKNLINKIDRCLGEDIPELLKPLSTEADFAVRLQQCIRESSNPCSDVLEQAPSNTPWMLDTTWKSTPQSSAPNKSMPAVQSEPEPDRKGDTKPTTPALTSNEDSMRSELFDAREPVPPKLSEGGRQRSLAEALDAAAASRPPMPPPQSQKPSRRTPRKTVTASHDYSATADDEVTFKRGDRISILEEDTSGWWKGRVDKTGEEGWFPINYVNP